MPWLVFFHYERHIAKPLYLLIVQVVGQKLIILPRLVFFRYERHISEPLFLLIVQVLLLKLPFLPMIYLVQVCDCQMHGDLIRVTIQI